jgi:hypothetical protein
MLYVTYGGMENLKFNGYLTRMKDIYFHAISAFYLYKGLSNIKNTNVVGNDKAIKNVAAMNKAK